MQKVILCNQYVNCEEVAVAFLHDAPGFSWPSYFDDEPIAICNGHLDEFKTSSYFHEYIVEFIGRPCKR